MAGRPKPSNWRGTAWITVMPKQSAGLSYREKRGSLEVLLVHPGGPFWANKDDRAWSIPKGELEQ
jgi:predicted NUDIX family NTP pyrophosphohydrolase